MATGAETTASAGKRHAASLAAFGAADASEALSEIATLQELAARRGDDRPPKTIAFLVTLRADRLELGWKRSNLFVVNFTGRNDLYRNVDGARFEKILDASNRPAALGSTCAEASWANYDRDG